ncbi:hypothetical protein ABS772_23690 [Methylorubrum podarium]|uniref:Transposase n=1 Tax=Methylorubrum podarium TaxID=200476 RepID=A0ABV1QU89_9HYPH
MNWTLTIKGKRTGTYAETLDLADRHGVLGRYILNEFENRRWFVFVPGQCWHPDGTELSWALARDCALHPVNAASEQSKHRPAA